MNRSLRTKIKAKGNWQSMMKSPLTQKANSNTRKASTGQVNQTVVHSSNSIMASSVESDRASSTLSRGSDTHRKKYTYEHMSDRERHLHKSFKTLLFIFGEADHSVRISNSKSKFPPRRKSISLSTGSGKQKSTTLNIKDFDPVFRARDFHEVRKRVHLLMIGDQKKYNSTRQKQEFKLKSEARILEREKLAALVVDQEQIDFLKDGN